MKNVTAIISARGGSKRVPRKNVIDICGHPLVAWSIRQALGSKHISDVWLTTDDDEIEQVGLKYGAKIIRRPAWLGGDEICGAEAVDHAMKYLESEGLETELYLSILPTTPLEMPRDYDRLIEAYHAYKKPDPPKRFGVVFGIRLQDVNTMRVDDNGYVESIIWDKSNTCVEVPGGSGLGNWKDLRIFHQLMREYFGITAITDGRYDDVMERHAPSPIDDNVVGFCEIEAWQGYDINLPRDVEMVRTMMEHKLLRGRGIEIYG